MEELRHVLLLTLALEEWIHHFEEIARRLYQSRLSLFHYCRSYSARRLQFSIEIEDVCQLAFFVCIDHVGCGQSGAFVHSHVERSVKAEAKPSRLVIEMVGADSQIGKESVDMVHAIVAHPVVEIAEIASHKGKILWRITDILLGIWVLVKTKQPSCTIEATQYLTAMSASSESNIHIDASRTDIETVNTLIQ